MNAMLINLEPYITSISYSQLTAMNKCQQHLRKQFYYESKRIKSKIGILPVHLLIGYTAGRHTSAPQHVRRRRERAVSRNCADLPGHVTPDTRPTNIEIRVQIHK